MTSRFILTIVMDELLIIVVLVLCVISLLSLFSSLIENLFLKHQFTTDLIIFDMAVIKATKSKTIAFISIKPMNAFSAVFDHSLAVVRCAREITAIK